MATKPTKLRTFRGGDYVANLMAELSRAGIAQRIALARDQAGLTQPELAEVMEVHWRTIQDWESPKIATTPWDRLQEIADITDVTRNWLLHGREADASADAETIQLRLRELEDAVADLARADDVKLGLKAIEEAIARLAQEHSDEDPPQQIQAEGP